jgi:hypothetical protein
MLSGGLRESVSIEHGFATEAALVLLINLVFLFFVGRKQPFFDGWQCA